MPLRHISGYMRRALDAGTVKAAILPANFYRAELPTAPTWKRAGGWVDGGLCPFHADHHAGSFRVHLDSGAFRCFACGAHGADILAFTMHRHGLAFRDALNRLSREWGL
jgi:putative DNA primase/helicase